jgi:hypothetical protein
MTVGGHMKLARSLWKTLWKRMGAGKIGYSADRSVV